MQENDLVVKRNLLLRASRTKKDYRAKPRATRPNQFWGIDMTKIMTDCGWAYTVIVIDWYSKKVVGHYTGDQSKAWHWLIALNRAINLQFPNGIHSIEDKPKLISDNGSQPTSKSFMKNCKTLGIDQIFTSYCNPKGNADTERFMRTLKEEICWINHWSSTGHLEKQLTSWISTDYNKAYVHSSLNYESPIDFEAQYFDDTQNTRLKNTC